MMINTGDIVQTIPTNRKGVVSGVYDKYITIEFLDGGYGDYILKNIERHIMIVEKGKSDNSLKKIDFKNLRQSKILLKELRELQNLLDSGINALQTYKKYVTIPDVLVSLKESKSFIEAHIKKHTKILDDAGVKEEK
jgi:hypothetical protein